MATENPTWGAPRIHGELRMLGFEVSERTVSRYLPRRPPQPPAVQRWLTFLRNHRDAIVAMEFFVVPTVNFRVLYVWFAIGHDQRRTYTSTSRLTPRHGSSSSCAKRSRSA